jgi:exopolysaccharide biosynthesis polyprenyl glycosylphosphotransferase
MGIGGLRRADAATSRQHSFLRPITPLPGGVQTRLQRRRPRAMRRHASRLTIRLATLLVGDTVGLVIVHAVAALIATRATWGILGAQPLTALASPSLRFFVPTVLLSLVVTGSYLRHSRTQASMRVLRGCLLAAALVTLGTVQTSRVAHVSVLLPAWAALIWCAITLARATSEEILNAIFAGARLAAPAALIGGGRYDIVPGEEETALPDRDYRVVCTVPTELFERNFAGAVQRLGALIDEHSLEAVIAPRQLNPIELEALVDVCLTSGCELFYSARSLQIADLRPRLLWIGDEPFFEFGTPALQGQQLIVKRCLDIAGGLVGTVALSPVLLLVALAVKLDSRGPVFFSQHRAGLGGRRFRMHKFRTMRVGADAEKESLAHLNHTGDSRLFKIPNDPRITRVGTFLRRWSLDELPQIWNVLRGEMSLVGPRPFFESDLEDYEAHHYRRLGAKPGLTGLWQVSGRSSVIDFEEVVRLDRQYIEQWSIWLDLSILLRTLPAVVRRSGAF